MSKKVASFCVAPRSFLTLVAMAFLPLAASCDDAHLRPPSAPDFDGRAHATLESPPPEEAPAPKNPTNALGANVTAAPSASTAPLAPDSTKHP
jgi:hypothetical protein